MENNFSVSRKRKKSLGRDCAAFGCSNTFYDLDGTRTGIHFFKFPQKNPNKRLWCNLIKRVDGTGGFRVTNSTSLCQEHFTREDIKRNPCRWKLKPHAVPSRNLPSPTGKKLTRSGRKSRNNCFVNSASSSTSSESPSVGFLYLEGETTDGLVSTPVTNTTPPDHTYSQTPLECSGLGAACMECDILKAKVKELQSQVRLLNSELTCAKKGIFSVDKLENDDSAVRFYTGFSNYPALLAVFDYLKPKLNRMSYRGGSKHHLKSNVMKQSARKCSPRRKLSLFEEFIFVLMRLKVGLFLSELADRFCISVEHALKIFITWINFLFYELPLLFPFPPKEKIQQLLPNEFSSYPSTRIVIDCTEVLTEVPSTMKSQSQTWSDHEHHNTWKVLVGVSPNGAVTFVSGLWSGRMSDEEITQKCGMLSLLEEGDNVMAVRGFDIAHILPPGVTLNVPSFKGRCDQLTPEGSVENAQIATIRIHVERAIGRIKSYHILDGVLPITLYPVANQIFTVCSYLTNFLPVLLQPSGGTH